jgi:hypothetical protein
MRRLAWLALPLLAASTTPRFSGTRGAPGAAAADTATVHVTRPTVVAYLVVPAGAVDTSADLAVLADDWNVAMATLGDSLEARGIRFTLATESWLRVRVPGRRDTVLALNGEPAAGYVFIRPAVAPCQRRGAAELDEVLRTASTLLGRQAPSEAARRAICGARSR